MIGLRNTVVVGAHVTLWAAVLSVTVPVRAQVLAPGSETSSVLGNSMVAPGVDLGFSVASGIASTTYRLFSLASPSDPGASAQPSSLSSIAPNRGVAQWLGHSDPGGNSLADRMSELLANRSGSVVSRGDSRIDSNTIVNTSGTSLSAGLFGADNARPSGGLDAPGGRQQGSLTPSPLTAPEPGGLVILAGSVCALGLFRRRRTRS